MPMNSLAALLGMQEAGPNVASRDNLPVSDDTVVDEILVEQGVPQRMSPESLFEPENPTNRNLRNDMAILNRNIAAQEGQAVQEGDDRLPGRKGIFGTTGTLRDVLGYLGDAFLMQGGANPVYGPRRRQERISDAMAGYADDPLAAIERVMGYDPQAGAELMEKYRLNQDRMFDNMVAGQKEQRMTANQGFGNLEETIDYAARNLSAAIKTGNPRLIQGAVKRAQEFANAAGVPLEQVLPLDQMSEEELAIVAQAGMTPYQQQRLPQMDRGLDIRQQNADTATYRARNPRPRNPTRATMEQQVVQKVNEEGVESLDEGERLVWKRMQEQARPKGGGSSSFADQFQELLGEGGQEGTQQRAGPIIRPVSR